MVALLLAAPPALAEDIVVTGSRIPQAEAPEPVVTVSASYLDDRGLFDRVGEEYHRVIVPASINDAPGRRMTMNVTKKW